MQHFTTMARRDGEMVQIDELFCETSVGHLVYVGGQARRVDDALQLSLDGCLAPKIILFVACKFAHNSTGNLVVDFVKLEHDIGEVRVAAAVSGMVIHAGTGKATEQRVATVGIRDLECVARGDATNIFHIARKVRCG